jgi:SAM-dependent methyltransferase
MAREFTGCEILNQKFLNLEIPAGTFDGIFANASLFHVPSQALPRVLYDLYTTLRPGGILFSSNPRGHDEGWSGQRFGHYMQLDTSKQYLEDAGFEIIDYYYRPLGKPKDEQPWLAMVANKPLL